MTYCQGKHFISAPQNNKDILELYRFCYKAFNPDWLQL